MLLPVLILVVCCLSIIQGLAQDFSGVWRGKLTQLPGGCYPEYFIEIQIRHNDVQLAGTTYDYFDTTRYVKLNFDGRVNMQTKRMVLKEESVVKYKIPMDCIPCIKTYDLTLSKQDNEEVLTGSWTGTKMGSKENCPQGQIVLRRVAESAFMGEEVLQTPELAAIQRTLKPIERKIEVVQTFVLDTSSIKLELYDNGQIDGDTISIFLNQQLIMYKKGLATKPITLTIPVMPSKDYEMIMFAENLGSIPPNTALMVVTAGLKKYEVYLSSSEIKSAAVRFRYEKKK